MKILSVLLTDTELADIVVKHLEENGHELIKHFEIVYYGEDCCEIGFGTTKQIKGKQND